MRKNGGNKRIEYCSLKEPEKEMACFNDTQFSNNVWDTAWYRELLVQWLVITMGVTTSYTQQEAEVFNRCLDQEITSRYLPQITF